MVYNVTMKEILTFILLGLVFSFPVAIVMVVVYYLVLVGFYLFMGRNH